MPALRHGTKEVDCGKMGRPWMLERDDREAEEAGCGAVAEGGGERDLDELPGAGVGDHGGGGGAGFPVGEVGGELEGVGDAARGAVVLAPQEAGGERRAGSDVDGGGAGGDGGAVEGEAAAVGGGRVGAEGELEEVVGGVAVGVGGIGAGAGVGGAGEVFEAPGAAGLCPMAKPRSLSNWIVRRIS